MTPPPIRGQTIKAAVKHNGNELEYAKSAKSNGVNLRKLRKIQFLDQFGPIWANLVYFGVNTFFFQKSENVTFLDLLKAKLMQKNQKNLMMGSMRTFVTDRRTDGRTD